MATSMTRDFVQELKDQVASSGCVLPEHPIIQGVAAGTIPLRQLQGWVTQDYFYRKHVPRLAMLRYLKCTDPEIAQHLYEVVEEETEGASTGTAGHVQLFLDFAAGLGVSREQLESARILPGAAAHVYWAELILHTLPWFVALAAQLAGEGQAPRTNALLRQGLQQHYGLDEKALRFCRAHEEADVEHSSLSELIVRRYVVTPELQAQARAVVQRKLELQYDMWATYQYF
ncbi:MAG TPA: iron-containing redox enzyme family protein [Chloroflexota bacterium]|nr:iron-containing redox enzyme family protein [Chloroflexota bacterium]